VFKPLEKLAVVRHGSVAVVDVEIDGAVDARHKPGLLLQTRAFLEEPGHASFLTLSSHLQECGIFYAHTSGCVSEWDAPPPSAAPRAAGERHIVLIGVGAIGFRHLQSLLNVRLPLRVSVVEISADIRAAAEKALSLDGASPLFRVQWLPSLDALPAGARVDLAIVATTSFPRRSVVERLLAGFDVKALLLEKVLFPTVADHAAVAALTRAQGVDAFVNVGRRHPWIAALRDQAKSPVRMAVTGTAWGLACNAVHLIDAFAFLNGAFDGISVDGAGLRPGFEPAKRDGYIELFGTLACALPVPGRGTATATLECLPAAEYGVLVEGACDEFTFSWRFSENIVRIEHLGEGGGGGAVELPFPMPMLSATNHLLIEKILTRRLGDVPTLAEVNPPSEAMIRAFITHLQAAGHPAAAAGVCPIT
jgi:predicted dehydrogenase